MTESARQDKLFTRLAVEPARADRVTDRLVPQVGQAERHHATGVDDALRLQQQMERGDAQLISPKPGGGWAAATGRLHRNDGC